MYTKSSLTRTVIEAVWAEAEADPELVKTAPHSLPAKRLDDVRAARELDLVWRG